MIALAYVESFNGKMREQFLSGELFYTLNETQIMTERWRTHYNMVRPHSSLRSLPPAPETIQLASHNNPEKLKTFQCKTYNKAAIECSQMTPLFSILLLKKTRQER